MSVIYLKSPDGGAKVAISEQEAQYDEVNGWRRFDPENPEATFPEPAPPPPAPEPQWAHRVPLNKDDTVRRKPGPKPGSKRAPRVAAKAPARATAH